MTYAQFPIERFRGLNLRSQIETDAQNYAIDGTDFDLDDGGVIRSRDWFNNAVSAVAQDIRMQTMATAYLPSTYAAGFRSVVLGAGPKLGAGTSEVRRFLMNATTGQLIQNLTLSATGLVNKILPFGTTQGQDVLLIQENQPAASLNMPGIGTESITQPASVTIDPITFVETTNAANTMPAASLGAVWANEQRVAYAGFRGATGGPNGLVSSPHHVWFSEPGRPRAFRTDAFVVLTPGDGEAITAIESWRDMLFVFKQTKFFVFQNVTSTSRGTPQFNFRPVTSGLGCVGMSAVAPGPNGLYFVSSVGIQVTRGGDPELVGLEVQPLWTRRVNGSFTNQTIDPASVGSVVLSVWSDKLVMSYFGTAGTATTGRLLVGDLKYGWWSIWNVADGAAGYFNAVITSQNVTRFYVVGGLLQSGVKGFGLLTPELNSAVSGQDYGSPVTTFFQPRYRTGFIDLAQDSKVRVRQVEVWGQADLNIKAHTDFAPSVAVMTDVLFLQSPETALPAGRALARKAFLGQRASLALEWRGYAFTTTPMKVSRVVMHISNKRVPSAI